MKRGVKKYYRKLEDRFEYDEDPNFGKPNFRHRRNVHLSNKGGLKAYLKREVNNIIQNEF